jgi:hypothetical protein
LKHELLAKEEGWNMFTHLTGRGYEGIGRIVSRYYVLLGTALMAVAFNATAFASNPLPGFGASDFGTEVRASGTVFNSTTTALCGICTFTPGISHQASVLSVNVGNVVTTGLVTTTASSIAVTGGGEAKATAQVNDVNLLNGLITATTLKSVSASIQDTSGNRVDASGTQFTNLVVGGIALGVTVPPNTVIALPLLGSVVVNEQLDKETASAAAFVVNAIHITITVTNTFGLPVGSQIIISHAQSKTQIAPGLIAGNSNDVLFKGLTTQVGPVENNVIPCSGTPGGAVVTRTLAGINVPSLLSTGTLATTAQGSSTSTSASGETTATIDTVNLLNLLLTADLIKADATATLSGGLTTLSGAGSHFVNLHVVGASVGSNPPPNTMVNLPGLGTLYLHRVIRSNHSIKVVMVDLVVTAFPNPYSLPLGAELTLGTATARIIVP